LMGIAFQSGRKKTFLMAAVWALFFGTGAIGFSQSEGKQVLHGTVVDSFGAVVANLNVGISTRTAENTAEQPEKQRVVITTQTDSYGQFSASLLPGSYDVCVPRFAESCRTIEIRPSVTPEKLVLKINPVNEIPNPALPESRFQKIAGPSARNCGHVLLDKNPVVETTCAMHAFKHHKPFYVIYDDHCIDCFSAVGMAWNSKGEPYSVSYDSMGISDPSSPASSRPDGSFTLVIACSQPLRVYINETGKIDCFQQKELWEQSIERGSWETLISAGETGYWELIPALKKRLSDPESFDEEEEKTAIGMALAKLGDREQQQEILCKLYQGSPTEMQTVALDQIPYVGGWYAIRIYRELLTPAAEARFTKAKLRFRDGDVALAEPGWWALSSLFKIAPSPPPIGIDYGFNLAQIPEYSQRWSVWIQQNRGRLRKLKPTGEGVDFSGKSCKVNVPSRQ
jgi:hypothetical protein